MPIKTPVLTKPDLAKAFLTFGLGILSTAIGFFLALYFNNKRDERNKYEEYINARKAIITETKYNQFVLENSFRKYFDGVIFGSFNTKVSGQQLLNPAFVRYADSSLLLKVQNYNRLCEICNDQKNQIKELRLNPPENTQIDWEGPLTDAVRGLLDNIDSTIIDLQSQLKK